MVAKRGQIKDRNGVPLVVNKTSCNVFIRPRSVSEPEKVASVFSSVFGLREKDVLEKALNKAVSEYTLVRNCSYEMIEQLLSHNLSGVYYSSSNERYYPYGDFLSQTLGYVSVDGSGQSGLEKYYDKYLRGTDGEILYETDLLGIQLPDSKVNYLPSIDGLDLVLTIDYSIQQIAEQAMETAYEVHSPKSAQCVVMDPSTGELLAMAIKPSYDMNDIPRDDLSLLNRLSRNGLIVDCYEPGSTFKILTAAANVEEYLKGNSAAFSPEHVFNDARTRTVCGRTIKCWRSHADGKHSGQHLQEALNNSCNPCFVDMALALGRDTLYEYVEGFNYGSVTGVDFIGEAQGMVVPKSAVTDGDLARIGFGQTIAVTPIQLAAATAAAINGGVYYTPHFVKAVYDGNTLVEEIVPIAKNRAVSKKTSATIAGYLEGVVADGSGKQAYIEGCRVGGKTGVFP